MDKRIGFHGYRIDDSVVFTMTGLIVLSLLVLGFRYRNTDPCMDVNVVVKAPNYYQGSLISFRADAVGGKNYVWDFGDGKPYESGVASVQRSFKTPGTYIISVVVNGHCEGFDTVTITERPLDRTLSIQPSFIAPDTATVNRPVTFIDTTGDATSWKWRFGERELVDGVTQKISYTYKTPGIKLVYLEINGRPDRASTRTIYVKEEKPLVQLELPRPRPNRQGTMYREPMIKNKPSGPGITNGPAPGATISQPPKPKVYPDIQADEVIILLQGVVTGEKKAADFKQYFCDEADIPVTYNGTPMKFSQMCVMLKDFKKLKKISRPEVQLIKNSSTNCIWTMTVNVDKQGLFKRVF
jgi:hypothetical protein